MSVKVKNAVTSPVHAVVATTKDGVPADADFDTVPLPGTLVVNTDTSKLYFRGDAAWILVTSA